MALEAVFDGTYNSKGEFSGMYHQVQAEAPRPLRDMPLPLSQGTYQGLLWLYKGTRTDTRSLMQR